MESQDLKNTLKKNAPGRRITISLTPASVVSSLLLLCAGFIAVFVLGILIGRGHDPEARIPEVAKMMPEPAPTSAPVVIAPSEQEQAPAQTGDNAAPSREHDSAPRSGGVIGQGDLGYPEHLKTPPKSDKPRPQEKPAQAKPAQLSKPAAQAQTKPGPATRSKPEQAAQQQRGAATDPVASRTAGKDTQLYRYVYQAASYKEESACERFTAKLKAAGFNARTQKSENNGVVWYRTVIDFTGKPDDTDTLRENLKKHGVAKVLLNSKVPAK